MGYSQLDNGHPKRYDIERRALKDLMDFADENKCSYSPSLWWEIEYTDDNEDNLPGPEDVDSLYADWVTE